MPSRAIAVDGNPTAGRVGRDRRRARDRDARPSAARRPRGRHRGADADTYDALRARAQDRGNAAPGERDSQAPGRQPRRDRDPGDAYGAGNGYRDRRRLLRSRPRRRARRATPTRRICSGRPRPAQSYLNVDAMLDVARRPAPTPSIPATVSSPRTRRSRAPSIGRRARLGRAARRRDRRDGRQVARAPSDDRGGRAGGAGRHEPLADADAAPRPRASTGLPIALKARAAGAAKGLKVARTLDELAVGVCDRAARSRGLLSGTARSTPSAISTIPSTSNCRSSPTSTATSSTSANATARCSAAIRSSWEEAPAAISERVRDRLREAGVSAARAIGYD